MVGADLCVCHKAISHDGERQRLAISEWRVASSDWRMVGADPYVCHVVEADHRVCHVVGRTAVRHEHLCQTFGGEFGQPFPPKI
jgi:hypothetical protein